MATKSPSNLVFVYDYSKHSSLPTDNIARPQHKCSGHSAEGYGLCWNPHVEGQLLSGSDDAAICLWDIREAGLDVAALQTRRAHTSVVEDVDWHRFNPHLFGSVGDDAQLLLWDARQQNNTPATTKRNAHADDVNCLSFNPYNEFLLATGGGDSMVNLWDLRKMDSYMHQLEGHREGVYQVFAAFFVCVCVRARLLLFSLIYLFSSYLYTSPPPPPPLSLSLIPLSAR